MSNDESPPPSGSRWEPAEQPPATPAATPAAGSPVAYAPAPPPRNRGRLLLAGGAVGVALVAGAGGFALGHASADEGDGPGGRFGGPGGVLNQFPGGPVPGGPQGGQGTFPGQGQDGLPPGFPGRDDDQDQHDGQPDDGTTQGSST
ncbi:hypothetical protein ISU07_14325 [Nocardioides islandensis]|jgi:hypothetical protein|uniref:Uncharacterized protein n=1 Tax=Nocardioides islandensis TaxID=433663 RepID=A0A930YDJ0_9ACTN|nr:hypothetical protein [Nocardioides islandensis]MBF4764306.1 hypothetical protein [Nocardioides islandensis]